MQVFDFILFIGFPEFCSIIDSAAFHSCGTCFNLNAALIKLLSLVIPFLGKLFIIEKALSDFYNKSFFFN